MQRSAMKKHAVGWLAWIFAALWAPASPATEPEELLLQSYELEAKGDVSGALRASERAADQNPNQYFARLRAAYLALMAKNYAQAGRDYQRAAELAPKAVEPLLGQQQAWIALGKYAEAESVGRAALERDPLNYLANSRLAWTLFSLKKYPEAAKIYRSILKLYPGDSEMMVGLGYSELRAGHKQRAQEAFRFALAMAPKHARATRGLAEAR